MRRTMIKAFAGLVLGLAACSPPPKATIVPGGVSSITAEELHTHLSFLASDSLAGRDTGSPGLERAAAYIAAELQRLRLKPPTASGSFLQPFALISRQLTPMTKLTVTSPAGESAQFDFLDDFFPYQKELPETSETITGKVAFVGYGIEAPEYSYNDFAGIDVKGKIVLAMRHEPQTPDTSARFEGKETTRYTYVNAKAAAAEAAGAAALILVNAPNDSGPAFRAEFQAYLEYLAEPKMRLAGMPEKEEGGGLKIIVADTSLATALLRGSGKTLAQLQAEIDRTYRPQSFLCENEATLTISVVQHNLQAPNVIGWLEGSDPHLKHEAVAYSAHLDHVGRNANGEIFNGADDDASGSSALLEIAEAFAQNDRPPRRSVLFLWFAGEEKGLLGSEYYADHPAIPLAQTAANLNMDMVGRVRPPGDTNPKNAGLAEENTIYVVGGHQNSALRELNEASARQVGLVCDYRYGDPSHPKKLYYRSDHYNFARHDVPVLFFTTGEHEDYHKPTDDVDKINFPKLQRVAQMAYLTGWQVANQAQRLKPNQVPASP